MKLSVNREVKILSLGFFAILIGYSGVQQYVTTFLYDLGMADVGFNSLILIYLFFAIFNPVSAIIVSKYGAKKCMVFSSLFYSLFIILLWTKHPLLIYTGSCLLGIAAALLWTAQNSYLIRASSKECYGENYGFFTSFQYIGCFLGVFFLGAALAYMTLNMAFLVFSVFPLAGLILLSRMKNLKTEKKPNRLSLLKKSFTSKTALSLSMVVFVGSFIGGLFMGIVPIEIKKTFGLPFVGILSSIFYIFPIFFSYMFGRVSDFRGRRAMIFLAYGVLIASLVSLLFSSNPLFLVLGIVLLGLNSAIVFQSTYALIADVSTERNLEFLIALCLTVQNMGVVSSLVLSRILMLEAASIYIFSIFVAVISFLILLPVLRLSTEEIRRRVSQEVK